jgi:fructose-bisphosphate aldolase class I
VEARRAYRELIVTTPHLDDSISGAILFDETISQRTKTGALIVEVLHKVDILPGIKIDIGATDLVGRPAEKIAEGLDGLRDRLKEYAIMGARFAKWALS